MSTILSLDWRYLIRIGLLAGAVTLYTSAVGMVAAFDQRAIVHGWLTLGQILLFTAAGVAGYLAANHIRKQKTSATAPLAGGIVSGFLSGIPLGLVIIVATLIDVRSMFVSFSPALINIVTFEYGQPGVLLFIGTSAFLGVIGAGVRILPQQISRALLIGLASVIIVGILAELFNQILRPIFGRRFMANIFVTNSLRPLPAAVLFLLSPAISVVWKNQAPVTRERIANLSTEQQRIISYSFRGLGIVVLMILPFILGTVLSETLGIIGMFIMMGLGLNIAVGLAGLLDLGYVANFAIGAYVMGVLTSTGPLGIAGLSFWEALPFSVLAAMIAGFTLALPVLRMRGDYLAIATLGFGEIIRHLAFSDWLRPLIGGAQGILFIPKPEIAGFTFVGPQEFYYIFLAGCLLAIFLSVRLNNSRIGRQWMAMREDEDVAAAMGINLVKTKVLAFTLSAAFGGLAGAIFAAKLTTIFPSSFDLVLSITVLSVIIVGGMASIPGVIMGALVLVGALELLREFAQFRLLFFGAALIITMIARPEGLWPSAIRQRELKEEEDDLVDDLPPPPGGENVQANIQTY